MSEVLLQTKLFVPPLRPSLLLRQHLIEKLNQGLHRKLTLISAPAGFGKTTLVAHWLTLAERPFAWVSLDEDDNDLIRFFAYVAAAVEKIDGIGKVVKEMLQAAQPAPWKSLATAFINDCLTAPPFVLVLDDYHLITETAVHEAVSFLLDKLPPHLHFIITSRIDPLLPLPRLRARGQLTELRTDALRFTFEEAADFLGQVMGLNLSAEQVSALDARTEGWIASLQMAALSLQGVDNEADVTQFVTAFAGSHRYIFDYLTDEVLRKRPSDTQSFLMQTALLDRFNAALCTAVTGQENSQSILQRLENANLFLFPLDEKREWYRYHHLFADLLRQRLQRRQPELVPELYRRASRWYGAQGDVETAVQYALAGQDVTAATRLLDQFAADFVRRSEIYKLHKLLALLPKGASDGYPRLNVAQGWVYMFSGEFEMAEKFAGQAEDNLHLPVQLSPDFPEPLVRAQVATIRAYSANRQGHLSEAQTFSQEALAKLEGLPDELADQLRGTILINLGQIQVTLDALAQATESYTQAIIYSEKSGRFFGTMASYSSLLFLQRQLGTLHAANATINRGLARLEKEPGWREANYPAEGEFRQAVGEIYYARNELDEAQAQFQRGAETCRYSFPPRYLSCLHQLFLVALARHEVETAVRLHQQIETELANFTLVPWSQAAIRSERLVRLSQLRAVAQPGWQHDLQLWLRALETVYTSPFKLHQRRINFIKARVWLALGEWEAALTLLNQMAAAAESASRLGDLIMYRIQQAIVLAQLSREETAVAHLAQAVNLAEQTDYLRALLDEADALKSLAPKLPSSPYRDNLLAHLQEENTTVPPDQSQLLDQLSERELEVVRLLTSHLSGPEIADRLHISRNTFKTHTKNIYSKLGVRSRNTAVARAKELNLL